MRGNPLFNRVNVHCCSFYYGSPIEYFPDLQEKCLSILRILF